MIDINYYMTGKRSSSSVIYNIETTNYCPFDCSFCPRRLMTRPVQDMDMGVFENVISQIRPWTDGEWTKWLKYIEKYDVPAGMSENDFFLHVIPKVITLHGYGEPLSDSLLLPRIRMLNDKCIPTYLSTHMVSLKRIERLFDTGLDYLKFSTPAIEDVVKLRDKGGYETIIVLALVDHPLPDIDGVYAYSKSQDQLWYKDNKQNKSIHWSEPCKYPWSSVTVLSNGMITSCPADYNGENIMGDSKDTSLSDIWNNTDYNLFRKNWSDKCRDRCDMSLKGKYE